MLVFMELPMRISSRFQKFFSRSDTKQQDGFDGKNHDRVAQHQTVCRCLLFTKLFCSMVGNTKYHCFSQFIAENVV